MYGYSGCLGGYVRPPPAALPDKGKRPLRQRPGQFARSSQDGWMSSSHEMNDNHAVLSSQALEKFSRALQDCQDLASASNNSISIQSSFENHALTHWKKQRQEWVGSERPLERQLREPVIGHSTNYEELLGTSRPFTQPVPLPEMVDFLVDVWEQEGLYT